MRLLEDIICIILLLFLPDCILCKFGIYDSIQNIMSKRANAEKMAADMWNRRVSDETD